MYFSSSSAQNKKSLLLRHQKGQNLSKKNTPSQPKPIFRLMLVWLVILAGIGGLGWRLYQLQIKQGSQLQDKARRQQMINLYPYIPRRSIIDSRNNVVATDKVVYNLY